MNLSRNYENTARKFAATLAFSALAFSVSAGAAEQQSAYTMTAISNASFGEEVTVGKYEKAIEKITAPSYKTKTSFSAATNLCVAYTKTGDLDLASKNCDMALEKTRARVKSGRSSVLTKAIGFGRTPTDLAIALSNRGVLHAVQGEMDLARQVFLEAIDVKSELEAAQINLARMDMSETATAAR